MSRIAHLLRSDVYVDSDQQRAELRSIAEKWNWSHATSQSTPESLADEAAELLHMSDFFDELCNKVAPSDSGISFLREQLLASASKFLAAHHRPSGKPTPKVDEAAAEQCGREAFRAGRMRAPAACRIFNQEILKKYMGGPNEMAPEMCKARNNVMLAFLRGWDAENAKAQPTTC